MNKPFIFQYIAELEQDLKKLISNNRFSELIIAEIINESIIQAYEMGNSSLSDEETAKGIVAMNIQYFYKPEHLAKVEDKYWNWDNRLQYGFRGRIMTTPDNLIRFRMSVDSTRKEVAEEKDAMLHAVRNFTFRIKPKRERNAKSLIAILAGFMLIVLASIGIYSYSISNRYQRINADTVFDKWTGKSIDVYDPINRSTDD
jgi:hypothetical protein